MFEICQFESETFSSEARCDVGTAKVSQLRYTMLPDIEDKHEINI